MFQCGAKQAKMVMLKVPELNLVGGGARGLTSVRENLDLVVWHLY